MSKKPTQQRQKNPQNNSAAPKQKPQPANLTAVGFTSQQMQDEGLPTHRTARPLRQQALLQIQKQQGNQHIQRKLIQRHNHHTGENPPARPQAQPPVRLQIGSVRLLPLWEYPIQITNPPTMNASAARLYQRLQMAASQSGELRDQLGYLQYAAGTGRSDLTAVQGARGAIGRRAGGGSASAIHTNSVVSTYIDAQDRVREQLPVVRAKQFALAAASAELRRVVMAGQVTTGRRAVDTASQNVGAVQARIARAKAIATGLIGPVTSLLQGKWQEAGIDLAKFVGTEIISAGVDAAYAPELRQAQAQLREARQNLAQFEDAAQAADLERAANALQSAKSEAEAAQIGLMRIVRTAERAETNLVELLNQSGNRNAADAIMNRSTTMEASAATLANLQQYQTNIQAIQRSSHGLSNLNNMLAQLMISPGGETSVPNGDHRNDMFASAQHNAQQLSQVDTWAQSELVSVGNAIGYVQGGSYLQNYNQIPTALQEALVNRSVD